MHSHCQGAGDDFGGAAHLHGHGTGTTARLPSKEPCYQVPAQAGGRQAQEQLSCHDPFCYCRSFKEPSQHEFCLILKLFCVARRVEGISLIMKKTSQMVVGTCFTVWCVCGTCRLKVDVETRASSLDLNLSAFRGES